MTRQDLVNKSIDKLNTVKEALELIEILEYDECIAVLTGTKNLPSEIHSALMRRPITGGQETGKNQPHRKEAIHENDRTGTTHQNPASEKNVPDKGAKRET